jgi:GrpB-like predicted nucleotidyltransferase (UPF0157 family)
MSTRRTVEIMNYDPGWEAAYRAAKESLAQVFRDTECWIEHSGSTAVPGLAAKPIVDMMLGIRDLTEIETRIPAIEALGYVYLPELERERPERRFFKRDEAGIRTHHVHGVEFDLEFWRDHILFRDYLRCHHVIAAEYQMLKLRLADRFRYDTEGYTLAKGEFINKVLAAARKEAGATPA